VRTVPERFGVPTSPLDAFDRRMGGRWTAMQRAKNGLLAALVPLLFMMADRLPAPWLVRLGRLVGRVLGVVLRRARRTARDRAGRCFAPAEAERIASACFANAGENLAVSLLLRRPDTRASDWVSVPEGARAALDRALGDGRGAIFVSAHLGPFELVAAAVAELGYPASVVVRESYDPRLDQWVDAHRRARGIDVIHRGKASAGIRIVRALRRGRLLGFLPDVGGRVPGVSTRFLGEAVSFPVGPERLAQRTGAPILVGTLARRPASPGPPWELKVDMLTGSEDRDGSDEGHDLTHRVATALERAIESEPGDWLWMSPSPNRQLPRQWQER
jgi:KDO2-lipid IV(A) lauroyltransferase